MQIFSTLDLAAGYWHKKLNEKDTEKLAFTTNLGLHEFNILPFGWKNSQAVFQRALRQILNKYLIQFALNYCDEIIVVFPNSDEHLKCLKIIFDICKKENIQLKQSKCNFAKEKINFLGYEVKAGKYQPSNANIEIIKKLQPPKNVKRITKIFRKCTYASKEAVGAVLKQELPDGNLHPTAFHSSKLRSYVQNYGITERFGLMQALPSVSEPFELLSVDTVGGLNYYNSTEKYIHITIDHATRYIWTFASKSVTTDTYISCLRQIFQIQVPNKILNDSNAAFTSSKFMHFLKNHNVKQLLTTANRPQTNGKVERVNQAIITRLKCKLNYYQAESWNYVFQTTLIDACRNVWPSSLLIETESDDSEFSGFKISAARVKARELLLYSKERVNEEALQEEDIVECMCSDKPTLAYQRPMIKLLALF
ncbi:Retrovirus-related Pol polyprotein from transposon 17.6, partial [Stegodyphus mimosarum]